MMHKSAKTLSIPEAGRQYYGLSRNGSYDAAARGDIPYIEVGRLKRVPVVLMERRMEETTPQPKPAGRPRKVAAASTSPGPPEAA